MKKSKLSADNFKKILELDGSTPEPAIRSGNTGQRIPCFDSCQLNTTLMCNQLSPGLPKLESVRINIGITVVRADGRSVCPSVGRSRDYPIFWDGTFIYPWCFAGALHARSSAMNK